jgi:hypothetical protein
MYGDHLTSPFIQIGYDLAFIKQRRFLGFPNHNAGEK